ncbi:Uncharacterized protein SAPIO_CDS4950 [Scedosporium apiospermum]|uniref:Clr5 domain-containing protein n=1 Tax=Pseudallescheria apiosperma TaxID=563466 RepID=A0A084G7E2_PSEDA|nr:Uncharacterized protein SAPIO_CDS4950 [Scedosporium apiospermum]KEZ43254.1 Uncharacterized protein SAPIO_CDS4950 [Scedosporium apiospermum]
MAPKRAYGVDWEPYREEIISRYVKQNQTAEATVKYLEERHGLRVTLRQFKYQFDGYKKLSADDWKGTVLPAVMKRRLEGKESDVYFRGEKLSPKRVRREQDRYRAVLPDNPSEIDTSEDFGESDNSTIDFDVTLNINGSQNCTTVSVPDIIRIELLRDLPYFQLQSAVMTGSAMGFWQIYRSDGATIVSEKLQELIPARSSPDNGTPAQIFLDNSQKPEIVQVFELAAFMASNNSTDFSVFTFLRWVNDNRQETALMRFLKLNTSTTRAFARKLVKAGARLSRKTFLKELSAIGIPFNHAAEELLAINDTEFRSFVLSKLRPESISGRPGGRLLLRVVESNDVLNAKTIICACAEINYSNGFDTPLITAVESGNLEMVKVLIKSGADPNFRPNSEKSPLGQAIQLLHAPLVRYLLDHGAIVSAAVSSDIASIARRPTPEIISMLEGARAPGETTFYDILSAASDSNIFSVFLSTHNVSEEMALLALRLAITRNMSGEVLCLIQHGPLRGCDEALRQVIEHGLQHLPNEKVKLFVKLLIQEGAHPDVFELLQEMLDNYKWDDGLANILIDTGFDLQLNGPRLVECALACGCHDAASLLIDRGTCINSYGDHLTPFQAVALKGKPVLLGYLAAQGAKINQKAYPNKGFTALQAASLGKSVEKVKFLVGLGADLHAPPAKTGGTTALEAAVHPARSVFEHIDEDEDKFYYKSDHAAVEIFRFLLKKGASVNRPGSSDGPLLHDIIERRLTSLLKEALDAGARPDQWWSTGYYSRKNRTPIQLAAERGDLEAVKLLIGAGGDINSPAHPDYGRTALQAAAASQKVAMEMIRFLLSQGADVHAPPARRGGVTALQGAAIQGHVNIALMFISELGADVNQPPALFEGRTAIEGAAEHGRLDMVQVLLNAGAVGDVLDNTGFKKAIDLARGCGHVEVAELLEAHWRGEQSGYLNLGL